MIADWLLNLPVVLMATIVFAGTYLVAWIVYFAAPRFAGRGTILRITPPVALRRGDKPTQSRLETRP